MMHAMQPKLPKLNMPPVASPTAEAHHAIQDYLRRQARKGGHASVARGHGFTSETARAAVQARWRAVRQERARDLSREAMRKAHREGLVTTVARRK